MWALFSDYKSNDQIDMIFAVKRLKAHYNLYSSLISNWEDIITESIRQLALEEDEDHGWLQALQSETWGQAECAKEMQLMEDQGIQERVQDLQEELKKVEIMLGNRIIRKKYAEQELSLCLSTDELVRKSESDVKTLRRKLRKYPKRMGLLNQKVGSKLIRRRRMHDVLDVLKVIKPTALLGCTTKRQMIRLIKEQDWQALEPHKFHNIVAVKQGIGSLRSKIVHFQREIQDEFCQQFQRPCYQSLITLMELLQGMSSCKDRWDVSSRKYAKVCKTEIDSLFVLLASPSLFIQTSLERLIGLWFNPLKMHEEEIEMSNSQSRSLRKRRSLLIEPSVIIDCLTHIADNMRRCMTSWHRLIKFTYAYANQLEQKVTDEQSAINFAQSFREALFVFKNEFLKKSIEELQKQIAKLREEQVGRMSMKHMLQLRVSLSAFYHDAQLFSCSVPDNRLEDEFENFVEVFLDQNFMSHLDLLVAMIRTADGELMPMDFGSFSKQAAELLIHIEDVGKHKTYAFANRKESSKPLSVTLSKAIGERVSALSAVELKDKRAEIKELLESQDGCLLSSLLQEPKLKLEDFSNKEQKIKALRIDYSGSAVTSLIIAYYKQWVYFPEYSEKVKGRLEALIQIFHFLNVAKLVSPVTLQFLLSGGFNLSELTSEDNFNQLENFHDIVLFQRRFNGLRKQMKSLDDFITASKIVDLKEKLQTSLADIFKLQLPASEIKEKVTSGLQNAVRIIWSFESIDQLDMAASHEVEVREMQDLLFYHVLLNQTKEEQVFTKIGKIKWEEVAESGMINEYVSEMTNSIRTTCNTISQLGMFFLLRLRSRPLDGQNQKSAEAGRQILCALDSRHIRLCQAYQSWSQVSDAARHSVTAYEL